MRIGAIVFPLRHTRLRKHLNVLLPGIFALAIALGLLISRPFNGLPIFQTEQRLPEFSLPLLNDSIRYIDHNDLLGHATLINVWASWCLSCRDEHPLLLQIANTGNIPIVGINYRDKREDALRWLEYYNSPYEKIGWDGDGQVTGNLGIDAIPVTLLVDQNGMIRFRHVGALTASLIEQKLKPLIGELKEKI